MLRGHNPLGINSSSYSFDNFFFTSSLSFFLETQETCGYSPKLLFVSGLKKKKKVERFRNQTAPTDKSSSNTKQFFHLVTSF